MSHVRRWIHDQKNIIIGEVILEAVEAAIHLDLFDIEASGGIDVLHFEYSLQIGLTLKVLEGLHSVKL